MTAVIWLAECALGAAAITALCLLVWNRSPAAWFCDYGEQPHEIARLTVLPHGAVIFAVLFLFCAALRQQAGAVPLLIADGAAAVFLILISAADHRYQIIPDQYILALALLGILSAWFRFPGGPGKLPFEWSSPLLGAVCGAALMLLMALAGRLLYRREALGFGDVKLFAALGLFAGFPDVFLLFFLAILLAFCAVVFLFLRKKLAGGSYFPLGPFLCLALLLFLAFHRQISAFTGWYFSLLNL